MKQFIVCSLIIAFYLGFFTVFADTATNQFHIIPEVANDRKETVIDITKHVSDGTSGTVMETYTNIANSSDYSLSEKLSSGILDWDSILQYLVYLIRFLSQIGLVIGAVRVIYAGYCYATQIFGSNAGEGNTAIKNAIIGILIIVFSYAIMKLLTAAFLGS